jgi:hypothetical protein
MGVDVYFGMDGKKGSRELWARPRALGLSSVTWGGAEGGPVRVDLCAEEQLETAIKAWEDNASSRPAPFHRSVVIGPASPCRVLAIAAL